MFENFWQLLPFKKVFVNYRTKWIRPFSVNDFAEPYLIKKFFEGDVESYKLFDKSQNRFIAESTEKSLLVHEIIKRSRE